MAALAGPRDTKRMGDDVCPSILAIDIADNVNIFKGAIVGLAGGYAAPAGAGTTKVAGIAEEDCDNTVAGHAAGKYKVRVRQGVFKVDSGVAAENLSRTEVGALCYAADDHTCQKTNGSGTLPIAGTVIQVDSDGVWVQFNLDGRS